MNIKKHVINVDLTAITSDAPVVDVPCKSCTVCCEKLSPYLTPDEISSGQYPISLTVLSNDQSCNPVVTMFKSATGGCSMLIDGRCSIYNSRPVACRQFDCRKNHHASIPNMVDQHE